METWANKREWLDSQFAVDQRLGIAVPRLTLPWESLTHEQRSAVLETWEAIRGRIPDHVIRFEEQIRAKQADLFEEMSFEVSCRLNSEIADLASRINDLNIWYRTEQEMEDETRRHG